MLHDFSQADRQKLPLQTLIYHTARLHGISMHWGGTSISWHVKESDKEKHPCDPAEKEKVEKVVKTPRVKWASVCCDNPSRTDISSPQAKGPGMARIYSLRQEHHDHESLIRFSMHWSLVHIFLGYITHRLITAEPGSLKTEESLHISCQHCR